jgi:hypothetical protein
VNKIIQTAASTIVDGILPANFALSLGIDSTWRESTWRNAGLA